MGMRVERAFMGRSSCARTRRKYLGPLVRRTREGDNHGIRSIREARSDLSIRAEETAGHPEPVRITRGGPFHPARTP